MWNRQRYFVQLDISSLCQSIYHHRHDHDCCPDRQLLRQVWLKGNEERQDLVKEKPGNGWKGQNKTKDPDHDHRVCQEYFSSARGMASYFRSIWGPRSYFAFHPPLYLVFRPGIVFELILHLFGTSLCFAVSPIIASWLHQMRAIRKSNSIESAPKCVYGWIRVQMTTHRESNSIQSTLSTGANRAWYERRGKRGSLWQKWGICSLTYWRRQKTQNASDCGFSSDISRPPPKKLIMCQRVRCYACGGWLSNRNSDSPVSMRPIFPYVWSIYYIVWIISIQYIMSIPPRGPRS